MPATAGRVRMPANNRVHSSAALQTHGIWQSAIGYDPYAPNKEEKKDKSSRKTATSPEKPETETGNPYASFQELLARARITGSNADEIRGACNKCGRVGHLTYQCRNFLSAKEEADKESKSVVGAMQAAVLSGLEKLKRERVKVNGKNALESEESSEDESESSEDESESSDSDYDSEIERAIAEKYGKSLRKRCSKSLKKYGDNDESDDDRTESKSKEKRKRERKDRGRSKKRSAKRGHDDSEDDEGRGTMGREKRRRMDDDSSDEDEEQKRRRRKERKEKHNDSTERHHKRRHRRTYSVSDSYGSGSDNPPVGRHYKRSDNKRRDRRHKED